MLVKLSDELEAKTRAYWDIGWALNGRPKCRTIEAGLAIEVLNDNIFTTNQTRPIVKFSENLLQEIITEQGITRQKPGKLVRMSRIRRERKMRELQAELNLKLPEEAKQAGADKYGAANWVK
jgi:hypothetical protein